MRRMIAVGVIAVAFALAGLPPTSAHGRVDQMNDWCSQAGYSGGSIRHFDPMGQSFVPTKPKLFGVDLFLIDPNIPNGVGTVLRVTIRQGTIQGDVVGHSLSEVTDGVLGVWWHFDFPKKLRLQPGDTYVIHVSVDSPSTDDFAAATAGPPGFPIQDAYPDGTRIESGAPTAHDLCFRTYGNGN